MNILIPHSWLLEHLETRATPQEIQKYLSLSGPSVERIYETEGESVYDIEVTTNRVDCMSVRGIAREAAVILTQSGIPSRLKEINAIPEYMTHPREPRDTNYPLPRVVNDSSLCRRITFMVISDIKKTPAPEWMQIRLRQVGINTHDSIIDITNYVTHDLGHPCHAFDYDKLMKLGGVVKVVKAVKGVKFTTLDGMQYETVGGEVVFVNEAGKIIDLPGIKGTANSAIDDETKNVLFWIESIDPGLIRFTSMTHSIRTVAAILNEKDVDPNLALPVFAKGVELFETLAGGTGHPKTFVDLYTKQVPLATVNLALSRISAYLGLEIPATRVEMILKDLGCHIKLSGNRLSVTPPTYRPDIVIPEDVVEEIARIYGYHNLPSILMTGAIPLNKPTDTNFTLEHEVKSQLSVLGGFEVYTYSLVSESIAKSEGHFEDHIKLKNPLTEDLVYLRRSLWASHAPILRTQSPAFVFELANVYIPADPSEGSTLPKEILHLTLTSKGELSQLKGVLDAMIAKIYLPPVSYKVDNESCIGIAISGNPIGKLLLRDGLVIIDLDWKILMITARKYPLVRSIPKVSPIIEDMTFSFAKAAYFQDISDTIKKIDPLIEHVIYKDTFKQNLTFTLYFQPKEEMSGQQLLPLKKEIVAKLESQFGAQLVGKI